MAIADDWRVLVARHNEAARVLRDNGSDPYLFDVALATRIADVVAER